MVPARVDRSRVFLHPGQHVGDVALGISSCADLLNADIVHVEDAVALAGVSKFPARIKCALLGWMAFKDAAVRINTTTKGV